MLSFSAVKLVKFPLGSTNKVKVKSSPLIVKFIVTPLRLPGGREGRDSILARVAGARLKPEQATGLGRSLFAPEEDGNRYYRTGKPCAIRVPRLLGQNAQHPPLLKGFLLSLLIVATIISDIVRQ